MAAKLQDAAGIEGELRCGVRVVVLGLAGRSELNGKEGMIALYDAPTKRWRVHLDDGSKKLFKTANLIALDNGESAAAASLIAASRGDPPTSRPSRAARDAIPPELLDEVLGIDGSVAEDASDAPPARSNTEHLEAQLQMALARITKLEEQQKAIEHKHAIGQDKLLSSIDEVAARVGAEGSGALASDMDARLRREASRLDDVASKLRALEGCLVEGGTLSPATVESKVLQERFEVIRKRTGWRATVSIKDAVAEKAIAERVASLAGSTAFVSLHTALGPAGQTMSNHRIGVIGRLCQLRAMVRDTPTTESIRQLQGVIAHAERVDVDMGQIEYAKSVVLRGRALVAIFASSSPEELERAVAAAERAGVDADELTELAKSSQNRIAEIQRRAAAQRRLRSAIAWSSKDKTDSLRRAITEAEEVGLDHADIQKGLDLLNSYAKGSSAQQSMSLSNFLRLAKPTWSQQSLEAALTKLACVGIASVVDMHEVLMHPDENHLNDRLRTSEQKVFSDETLKAFRTQMQQLA
mmetsp:Transcript_20962/g.60531  ORF Transcript_20962/g.60531 Transcript_20962/m.60531 type:complete len:526 (+) Transcript_20962:49-1626(+)